LGKKKITDGLDSEDTGLLQRMFNDMFDNVTSPMVKQADAFTLEMDSSGQIVRVPENTLEKIQKALTPEPVYYDSKYNTVKPTVVHPLLNSPKLKPVADVLSTSTQGTKVKPEWVGAMIFNESSGTMNAKIEGDNGKSIGITQIKDETWTDSRYQKSFKEKFGRSPQRTSLNDQVRMGTIILGQLYDEWNGNLEYVFRAYNSGSESLRQQLGINKWTKDRTAGIKNSSEYWNKINNMLNQ
jgi:hypothetical protein